MGMCRKSAGHIDNNLHMSRKEGVRCLRLRLETYFGMCRKVAGPTNIKATLRMRLPTVTNAGPSCGCGKKE